MKLERIDQIAGGFGIIGPEGDSLPKGGNGLLEPALVLQHHPEIGKGLGKLGLNVSACR